jgi:hypothetical protein
MSMAFQCDLCRQLCSETFRIHCEDWEICVDCKNNRHDPSCDDCCYKDKDYRDYERAEEIANQQDCCIDSVYTEFDE